MFSHKQQQELKTEIMNLRRQYYYINHFGGWGYCGLVSAMLKQRIIGSNPSAKILIGEYLRDDTEPSKAAREALIANIRSIPDGSTQYGKIKEKFKRNGYRIGTRIGHVVVVIDDNIVDPTHGQFGLPMFYETKDFKELFIKLSTGDIVYTEEKDKPVDEWTYKNKKPYYAKITKEDFVLEKW